MAITPAATNYLTQSPSALFKSYDRSATLHSLASKVALAAMIAIATATMAIVLLGITLSGPSSFLLLGSLISTPFLMNASSHWADRAERERTKATIEAGVVNHLNHVSSWSDEQIKSFFEAHRISAPQLLHSRNYLIARHLYWLQRAQLTEQQACLHLERGLKGSQLDNIDATKLTAEGYDELCHHVREIGFCLLETEMLPAVLQSALMLELISNPYKELRLTDVGTLAPKPIEQRLSERVYDQKDVYLTFKDKDRAALGAEEIRLLFVKGKGIDAIRQRMFG